MPGDLIRESVGNAFNRLVFRSFRNWHAQCNDLCMENSIYIGLSGQMALQTKMNIIANNVANMNTPGFRGQNTVFEEYIDKPTGMREDISMVLDYGQYQITDAGPVKTTGNPLDVAIVGPGFIGIQTPGGVQYTRAGNFGLSADGKLINARGMAVANSGGGDIIIPADAQNVYIAKDGTVSTDNGELGRIMIHEFSSEQILEPVGNSLYKSDTPGTEATQTTMVQGKLEGSNVQSIVEMTRMIDVLREYQSIQNMMRSEHDRQRSAIQRILGGNG